ncbi:MAG TPA: methyltransferase domain-containing protein [Polyangiaceae bacterium]|nr:methyltransferase domain-containing protein [Polyangiaceae bacterium]
MSEEHRAPAESSPDGEDVAVAEPTAAERAAARRARRAKAKLALRIPDDEVVRPEAASGPDEEASARAPMPSEPDPTLARTVEMPAQPAEVSTKAEEPIRPARIISVGPPPPDAGVEERPKIVPPEARVKSVPPAGPRASSPPPPRVPSAPPTVKIPSAPPTAKLDEDADRTMELAPVGAAVLDHVEADIDVPVDEEIEEDIPISSDPGPIRARIPTITSAPPPVSDAAMRGQPVVPRAPKVPDLGPPLSAAAAEPSEDALEIDEDEVAAVLSSRPPPALAKRPSGPPPPAPPARAPLASRPPIPTPIPADALSSTPQLDSEQPKQRPLATALIDSEEMESNEERQASDSGDEIDTSDVLAVEARAAVVTPPKPPPATTPAGGVRVPPPPVPPKPVIIPIVAPVVPSPLAPPPLQESALPRRRARPWWEDLFNDDFIRTIPKFTDSQIAAECDFIEDSLGVARGGSMLDLGCGTGSQAVELSRRGYNVVGFDLSLAMLARAGEEAQEKKQKINFVQGDMREMTFDEAFDGVYSWGTSFGYFEEEKNAQVVSKVHRALRKGGQFLLDVANRDFIIEQAPSLAWFEGEGCVCMDEMTMDWVTSRMRVKRTMMLDDGRSKEIEYSIRVYSLHELGKMLHDHGFRIAEVSGRIHTPGVFFGPHSPRTLILAEKR